MTVIVFCGPTISADEVRLELDAVCLPPVSQGDVYRAALRRPAIIGIVDGYFRQVPAVWHKEILWAMAQGISVFGSGSMGALRAAELAPFGMYGIGRVFEDYVSGRLEDDDEVAIVHGPADSGYRPLSEPMVNIRYTLQNAQSAGVISAATKIALVQVMKGVPYSLRSYQLLYHEGIRRVPQDEMEALRAWLPEGRVDQKGEDARLMLRAIRTRLEQGEQASEVKFTFYHTIAWENLICAAGLVDATADEDDLVTPDLLLDELQCQGDELNHAMAGASCRYLALEETRRRGYKVSNEVLREAEIKFRSARGLADENAFDTWLSYNHLSRDRFRHFLNGECLVGMLHAQLRPVALCHLADHLRAIGRFADLASRAADKQRVLRARGLEHPELSDVDLSLESLIQWYIDRAPLGHVGFANLLRVAEEDPEGFIRAAMREYLLFAPCRRERRGGKVDV